MMASVNKVLFIVGPTASGKTDLAFQLAKKCNGYLINADSKQVYKGLDIISGKDLPQNSAYKIEQIGNFVVPYYQTSDTRIYLLDIVEPQEEFSVHAFITLVLPTIRHIQDQNKLPIIVGGSGFYISALLNGVDTLATPRNKELRDQLEQLSLEELQEKLKHLNPQKAEQMNNSDIHNPRRLIRALEVAISPPTPSLPKLEGDCMIVGLRASRGLIQQRIDARIENRLLTGALDEAGRMMRKDLSVTAKSMNGLIPLIRYVKGEIDKEEAMSTWRKSEYLNAKKQDTWFRKDLRIIWYDITDTHIHDTIVQDIRTWLERSI